MATTTRFSEDLTRRGDKVHTVRYLEDFESFPPSDETLQDDKPMQRSVSYNTFISERKTSVLSEDPAVMTIEFLRARLLSERNAAKAAKQKAELLAKKVLELQRKLEAEVVKRRTAEDLVATVLEDGNRESKLVGAVSPDSLFACSVMEKGESNEASCFERNFLTKLTSKGDTKNSAEDELAETELLGRQKTASGEGEIVDTESLGKPKGALGEINSSQNPSVVEDKCTVEVAHQAEEKFQCNAYCYGPRDFTHGESDDVTFMNCSNEEKYNPARPALHPNLRSVTENSHQIPRAMVPVTQIIIPGSENIYLQEMSSSGIVPQYQKARIDTAKNEEMTSATIIRTTSPIDNRGCLDHGCSVHAGSLSGAKAKLPPHSKQLTRKGQQENKRGTVEGNFYPYQGAQNSAIMGSGFQRKFDVPNPKRTLYRNFQKGINASLDSINERNQNLKQFDGNIQVSNFQALPKQVKSAARCVLLAEVSEKDVSTNAVNLKAGTKATITPSTFHAELENPGVAVSSPLEKELDQNPGNQSWYRNNHAHSMDNIQLTYESSSDSSANFQDGYDSYHVQGSRSIVGNVSSRHKPKRQQLECLNLSTGTESAPSRRAQNYVDVLYSTQSSGVTATVAGSTHDNQNMKAHSVTRAEGSNIGKFWSSISLDMDGKHELISSQIVDLAQESLEAGDQNEAQTCIQEGPFQSVLVQNDSPTQVAMFEPQEDTPSSEALVIFAEHIQPRNQKFLEIKSVGLDSREQAQVAGFIQCQDIQGRHNKIIKQKRTALPCSTSVETLKRNVLFVDEYYDGNREGFSLTGGSPTAAHCFGTMANGYSSSEEPETSKTGQPSLVFTTVPKWNASPKPSHCVIFRTQPSVRDRDWHAQEHLPVSHKERHKVPPYHS